GSFESGRCEVFIQTLAADGGRWQISTEGGNEPDWRADGKELYYVSPDDFLTAVEIQRTGDTVRAGTSKKLFPVTRITNRRNRYVVSADGQRFLAVTAPPEKTPEPLTVVLNWPALLKQKQPPAPVTPFPDGTVRTPRSAPPGPPGVATPGTAPSPHDTNRMSTLVPEQACEPVRSASTPSAAWPPTH